MINMIRDQLMSGRRWIIITTAVLVFGLNCAISVFAGQGCMWKVIDTQYEAKIKKTYNGMNENVDWVREILVCPGGWNGSNDYQRFNNSGLQRYRVAGKENGGKPAGNKVIFHTGDLVFPDGTVWYKNEGYVKGYSAGPSAWEKTADNSNIDDCGDEDAQYEYARNEPSALAIADAWDGVKNLISGPQGTHEKEDGYYASNALSWYKDIGNGAGSSRLPAIEEYQKASEGAADSLLYGTKNYAQYQWSGAQDEEGCFVFSYSAEGGKEGREIVSFPFGGCWVMETGADVR